MFKIYFLAVTYGIAFLIIGVCLRKLVVNGDFIVHEYFSVDLNFVWETIFETIPDFKKDIAKIISDFD